MRSLWKVGVAALLALELLLAGCGDTYRPIINPIVRPGGDPGAFDAVVGINTNPSGAAGSVSEVNVSGDVLTGVRSIGKDPVAMAFDSTRVSVFVANRESDTVTVTALSSQAVVTISLLQGSSPAAVTGAGSGRIYVANTGATGAQGQIPACANGSVGILDSTSAVLLTNVCLPSTPVFLFEAPARGKLYVISQDGRVRVITTSTGTLAATSLTVGTNPVAAMLNLDGTLLYVLNRGSNDISVIDVATDTVTTPSIAVGGTSPSSFTLDRKLNRVYVANTGSDSVSIFDAATNPLTPLRTVAVGPAPNRVAVLSDGSKAYVSNTGSNEITEINSTGFQTTSIRVRPAGMTEATADATVKVTSVAASNNGSKVYGAFVEPTDVNNGIAIVRTADRSLILTLPAPSQDIQCDPTVPNSNCTTLRQRPLEIRAR